MPTYEVRRVKPTLTTLIFEAASEDEARWFARQAWVEDAKDETAFEAMRVPVAPDDSGDARSEARYEQTATDDESEQTERERWGLGGAESPREGTEA
jgi:hypothetical protein